MNEGLESLSYKEVQKAGSIQAAEEKAQEDLINVYKYLEGGCEEDRASVCESRIHVWGLLNIWTAWPRLVDQLIIRVEREEEKAKSYIWCGIGLNELRAAEMVIPEEILSVKRMGCLQWVPEWGQHKSWEKRKLQVGLGNYSQSETAGWC